MELMLSKRRMDCSARCLVVIGLYLVFLFGLSLYRFSSTRSVLQFPVNNGSLFLPAAISHLSSNKKIHVADILEQAIKVIQKLRTQAKDVPATLKYEYAFKKADELFQEVKQLKTDIQIAKAASRAKDCCELPVERLVTIAINLIDAPQIAVERLPIVIRAIRNTYPNITCAVGIPKYFHINGDLTELKVQWIRQEEKSASILWSRLLYGIKTPYVLVAKQLLHFDNNAFLENQVRFLESTGAAAVGGASRDLDGYWKAGCYQMKLGVYTLKLEEGYRRSVNACMKCDFIDGPFLVRRTDLVLQETRYQNEGLLEWFFKLFLNNSVSLVCPEIMFYHSHLNMSTVSLKRFAQANKLDTFIFPDNTSVEFSCSTLRFSCHPGVTLLGHSLPRCCIRNEVKGLAIILDKFKESNISYFLDAGTLLAAIKIGNGVTWDIDTDVRMEEEGYSFLNPKKKWIENHSYTTIEYSKRGKHDGKVKFLYKHNRLEFLAQKREEIVEKTNNIPTDLRKNLTLVKIDTNWFIAPGNPALHAKMMYGDTYLQHQHKHLEDRNNYTSFHNFHSCKSSMLHTCINQYPQEGNLDLFP